MALLGGEQYARDLAAAKNTFSARVQRYAHDIAPGYAVKVKYITIHPRWDMWAEHFGGRRVELAVNNLFIEANMYNLDSEVIVALPAHELCHIKVFIEDNARWLKDEFLHTHRDKRFVDCVKQFVPRHFAKCGPHPARLSFKHYLGSSCGVVPPDIFYIFSYYCPQCNETWDENVLGRYGKYQEPDTCLECGGSIEDVVHLTPRDVVRLGIPDDLIIYL